MAPNQKERIRRLCAILAETALVIATAGFTAVLLSQSLAK